MLGCFTAQQKLWYNHWDTASKSVSTKNKLKYEAEKNLFLLFPKDKMRKKFKLHQERICLDQRKNLLVRKPKDRVRAILPLSLSQASRNHPLMCFLLRNQAVQEDHSTGQTLQWILLGFQRRPTNTRVWKAGQPGQACPYTHCSMEGSPFPDLPFWPEQVVNSPPKTSV